MSRSKNHLSNAAETGSEGVPADVSGILCVHEMPSEHRRRNHAASSAGFRQA